MACLKYEEKINLLIDGELTDKEEVRVKKHIEACPACKGYYNALLLMHSAFDELSEEEAPEGFAASVMERVKAERKPKRQISFRLPFTAAAAVIVVVLYALNGSVFNLPKLADMTAKEKASDSAAADGTRGYGATKSAETQTGDTAEQPTLSVNQSQYNGNYSLVPDTVLKNESEGKVGTGTTVGGSANTEPAAETENKQATAPLSPSDEPNWSESQGDTKYLITGTQEATPALKNAVDTAPILGLGKVRFAYYVTPKDSLKEKLSAYTSFAQAGSYTYYKLTADEWNSICGDAENTTLIEGITADETAEYGVIVVPAL